MLYKSHLIRSNNNVREMFSGRWIIIIWSSSMAYPSLQCWHFHDSANCLSLELVFKLCLSQSAVGKDSPPLSGSMCAVVVQLVISSSLEGADIKAWSALVCSCLLPHHAKVLKYPESSFGVLVKITFNLTQWGIIFMEAGNEWAIALPKILYSIFFLTVWFKYLF